MPLRCQTAGMYGTCEADQKPICIFAKPGISVLPYKQTKVNKPKAKISSCVIFVFLLPLYKQISLVHVGYI